MVSGRRRGLRLGRGLVFGRRFTNLGVRGLLVESVRQLCLEDLRNFRLLIQQEKDDMYKIIFLKR